jgi:hypothetical protein
METGGRGIRYAFESTRRLRALSRCNSVSSRSPATGTMLAMLMNRPCSDNTPVTLVIPVVRSRPSH